MHYLWVSNNNSYIILFNYVFLCQFSRLNLKFYVYFVTQNQTYLIGWWFGFLFELLMLLMIIYDINIDIILHIIQVLIIITLCNFYDYTKKLLFIYLGVYKF